MSIEIKAVAPSYQSCEDCARRLYLWQRGFVKPAIHGRKASRFLSHAWQSASGSPSPSTSPSTSGRAQNADGLQSTNRKGAPRVQIVPTEGRIVQARKQRLGEKKIDFMSKAEMAFFQNWFSIARKDGKRTKLCSVCGVGGVGDRWGAWFCLRV